MVERQKQTARNRAASRKARRAKQKEEYEDAIASKEKALAALADAKKQLAEVRVDRDRLLILNQQLKADCKEVMDVADEYDLMFKDTWNWMQRDYLKELENKPPPEEYRHLLRWKRVLHQQCKTLGDKLRKY